MRPIYTYADGRPIEGRPDADPPVTDEDFRAWREYEDRAREVATRAFDRALKKALRRETP